MNNDIIQGFKNWVDENPGRRQVRIDIGEYDQPDKFMAWAFDYEMGEGQHVTCADEINLEETRMQKELKTYELLKAKFKGCK